MKPLNRPLAWIKDDRLLLDDVTRFGLHRLVYARKGEWPDVDGLLTAARMRAQGAEIYGWLIEREEFWFLWLVWKG